MLFMYLAFFPTFCIDLLLIYHVSLRVMFYPIFMCSYISLSLHGIYSVVFDTPYICCTCPRGYFLTVILFLVFAYHASNVALCFLVLASMALFISLCPCTVLRAALAHHVHQLNACPAPSCYFVVCAVLVFLTACVIVCYLGPFASLGPTASYTSSAAHFMHFTIHCFHAHVHLHLVMVSLFCKTCISK